jgi:hypothetical protein
VRVVSWRVKAVAPAVAAVPREAEDGAPPACATAAGGLALVPRLDVPTGLQLNVVVNALRQRKVVADRAFDAIYPAPVGARSWRYWTPVDVARRAAEMLVTDESTRVLDVGSGAGKFCLVGALTTPGHFTGIEQRVHLVEMAEAIARRYGASRASYLQGDMREVDWHRFDAFYFYNPFAENTFTGSDCLDDTVELDPRRYERDLAYAVSALSRARVGTRVVTYHGLGRDLPKSYERFECAVAGSDVLELWIRVRA